MALTAAASTSGGPSKSGAPCPKLTALCCRARALISVKMVVPNPATRRAISGIRLNFLYCKIGVVVGDTGKGVLAATGFVFVGGTVGAAGVAAVAPGGLTTTVSR